MTPVRIHIHSDAKTILSALGALAVAIVAVWLIVATVNNSGWVVFLFSCWWTILGLGAFYELLFKETLWIEIGARLTYRTLFGVHTHEWADIKAIQFIHTVAEDFSVLAECVYVSVNTSLVITLRDGKKITLDCDGEATGPPCGTHGYRFDEDREKIVRTLVDGLRDDEIYTRRRAADALARFRPDAGANYSGRVKELPEDFRQAAAEAQRRGGAFKAALGEAVPYLNGLMQDPDENVRKAATEALRRTAHPSHEPRTISEPGTGKDKPTEWRCPSCGETVRSDFDLCWNCQGSRPKSREPRDEWRGRVNGGATV